MQFTGFSYHIIYRLYTNLVIGAMSQADADLFDLSDDSSVAVSLKPFYSVLEKCNLQLNLTQQDRVVDAFVALGAEKVDDLKLLDEKDLIDYLPLIKCRKLILFLKGTNAKDVENAHVVSTPLSASTVSDINATCSSTSSSVSEFSENLISLPIQRFSRAVKECLETKKRPTPKERREVVRVLCDELLDKRHPVQRKDIRFLAKLMVQHYPLSFEDRSLGGTKIEDGTFTLFAQMENRLYNMRRTSDVSTESSVDDEDVPRKRSRASWHGCYDTSTNNSTANELEV